MNEKNCINAVDCAIIFMLEEERNLFLEYNKDFIICGDRNSEFVEFYFFDRDLKYRTGVLCSGTDKMGNNEACKLFYKLSRQYTADLYINLGVAGVIDDMNIGDVLVATRLSTMGENNANNTERQLTDLYSEYDFAASAVRELNRQLTDFGKQSHTGVNILKSRLKECGILLDDYSSMSDFKENVIRTGWCITVPEVIKDRAKERFDKRRKANLVDMEAYYLASWHRFIGKHEPNCANIKSEFLVFKSVSDYGDEHKRIMEECGSRTLAMKNLSYVVSAYCTRIHKFCGNVTKDLYTYFLEDISKKSVDSLLVNKNLHLVSVDSIERFFDRILYSENKDFVVSKSIQSALELLQRNGQALFLSGRSGTGKSTYLSFLYQKAQEQYPTLLIDFSKFIGGSEPNSLQLVLLLNRWLSTKPHAWLFLDGIEADTKLGDCILNILNNSNINAVNLCVVKYKQESVVDLYEVVAGQKSITELYFSGMSIYAPNFDDFISDGLSIFNLLTEGNHTEDKVSKFIKLSGISSLDFRLFSMIAEQSNSVNKKSIHTFISNYVTNKYGKPALSTYGQYAPPFNIEGKEVPKNKVDAYQYIAKNPYCSSLAVCARLIELINKNDDELNSFLQQDYVLSDDMNLLLETVITAKASRNDIAGKILRIISNSDAGNVHISVETQFLYNLSRLIKPDSPYHDELVKLIDSRIKTAGEILDKPNNSLEYCNWVIMYRTMSIIKYNMSKKKDSLTEFNRMMLEHDCISRYNLVFHLFYYSKRAFVFNQIHTFDIDWIDYEMFYSTYYVLRKTIAKDGNGDWTGLLSAEPFISMNLITFLKLVESVVVERRRFTEVALDAVNVIGGLLSTIENARGYSPEKGIMNYMNGVYGRLTSAE